jgi:transcription elongation GreA/GreB family factor
LFIGAGLGKHSVDGQTVLFLSPAAPLAKTLLDKKSGDEFSFNSRTLRIEDLF